LIQDYLDFTGVAMKKQWAGFDYLLGKWIPDLLLDAIGA